MDKMKLSSQGLRTGHRYLNNPSIQLKTISLTKLKSKLLTEYPLVVRSETYK